MLRLTLGIRGCYTSFFPASLYRRVTVRTETRRQLKHDKFAETVADQYSWVVEHRTKLIYAAIVIAVAAAAVIGAWIYNNRRNAQASVQLGNAMLVYSAPIRPAGAAPIPDMQTFASSEERARTAHAEFEKVAKDYSHTDSGVAARYFAAVTAREMGDDQLAEKEFKQAADAGGKDMAALAKLALAGLYADTGKDAQAIDLYKELSAHPTDTVAKSTAQLKLAQLYQTKDPQEAAKIYQQIQKEAPGSAAAQIAARNQTGQKQ
jgi:TolA-binding protein